MTDGVEDGPRTRRMLWGLVEERTGPACWAVRTGRPVGEQALLDELGTAVDAVLRAPLDGRVLPAALAHAVDLARYWQEPDEIDHLLTRPAVRRVMAPLAARVAVSPPRWWSEPCEPAGQWLVDGDGDVAPEAAAGELDRWRRDTLDDEERAATRPSDVRAPFSGHWWSTPAPSTLPSTIRADPAGLSLVEDSPGRSTETCRPVSAQGRVLEITGAADWVDLVRAHPLEVTRSRRHDWWRATGVDGRWSIPDWAAVARDHDAVHLTVRGYLQAAGVALPVGDGTHTVLAGWDPDRTWWLTGRLRAAGEPQRWVRTGEVWARG
ncbi:hypothetical protein [Pseudonocardia hydrocarbonoxydans]|uniref:hypothetical protein n=1 Tax=Pseudonocardia hydrocarbonoxydans TaxID=76726 RepID=UPI0014772AD1|nr:hypothetical protein [Pseudonocardia hydrocarbonoxydans]